MKHNYWMNYSNVCLRPLERSDIEFLRRWRNDRQNSKHLSPIPYITKKMQEEWFENYLHRDNEITFAIDEIDIYNRIVGSVSLYEIDGNRCLFGKILVGDCEARGHAIGTNATIAAIKIAREQMGMTKIYLYVYEDNAIALNIYNKVGFCVVDKHVDYTGRVEYIMKYKG